MSRLWRDRESLINAADAATSMVNLAGWDAVERVLRAELEALEGRYESTQALSHADYALLHGRIAGLRAALQVPDALSSVAQRAEQELDHENAAESALVER